MRRRSTSLSTAPGWRRAVEAVMPLCAARAAAAVTDEVDAALQSVDEAVNGIDAATDELAKVPSE